MREQAHKDADCLWLEKVAPGIYVDDLGLRYFYLSGLYVCVNSTLLRHGMPITPGLLADILDEFRRDLSRASCIELMD
jgi:hypothetical protein